MLLLALGLVLWSLVHLLKAAAPEMRAGLVSRLGLMPYKGLVSVLLLISVLLIVFGWRSVTAPAGVYLPPAWGFVPGLILIYLGLVLMAAANMPSNLKQWVRHPQLTGFMLWALAHLLLNGDGRSLLLFGGLGLWALLEMVFINRRDGIWIRPGRVSLAKDAGVLVAGVVAFVLLGLAHPWLTGVKLVF